MNCNVLFSYEELLTKKLGLIIFFRDAWSATASSNSWLISGSLMIHPPSLTQPLTNSIPFSSLAGYLTMPHAPAFHVSAGQSNKHVLNACAVAYLYQPKGYQEPSQFLSKPLSSYRWVRYTHVTFSHPC